MDQFIRQMEEQDRPAVMEMMERFYSSEAVFTNGSQEIFRADIDQCVQGSPYLEGYVFQSGDTLQGYAMVAKSFSAEFGKPCIWIEDLYLEKSCRGMGLGTAFLKHLEEKYPEAIFRLEVEAENECAVHVYKKCGFDFLPYLEMKK